MIESRPCHQRIVHYCASKNYEQRQLLILSTSSCFHSSGILQQLLLSRHVFAGRNSAAQVVLASNIKIAKRGHQEGASLFQKKLSTNSSRPPWNIVCMPSSNMKGNSSLCVCVCVATKGLGGFFRLSQKKWPRKRRRVHREGIMPQNPRLIQTTFLCSERGSQS